MPAAAERCARLRCRPTRPGSARSPLAAPPCTGKSTDAVKADIVDDAIDFFGPRLDVRAPESDGAGEPDGQRDEPRGRHRGLHRDRHRQHRRQPHRRLHAPRPGACSRSRRRRCSARPRTTAGTRRSKTFTVTVLAPDRMLTNLITAIVDENPALRALLSGPDLQRPRQRTVACVSLRTFTTLAPLLADARRGLDRRRQPDPGGARLLKPPCDGRAGRGSGRRALFR